MILETEEMRWLLIFTQLRKVHLSLGFLCISPGCGDNKMRMSKCTTEASPGRPGRHSFTERRSRVIGQVTHITVSEIAAYLPVVT